MWLDFDASNMAAAVGIVFPIVPTHHQYVNLLCRVHLVNTVYPAAAAAAEAYNTVADDIREDTCRVIHCFWAHLM